jgi:hypothetical protein
MLPECESTIKEEAQVPPSGSWVKGGSPYIRGISKVNVRVAVTMFSGEVESLFFFFFESSFYYATVSNTCTAYLRRSQQVMGEEGEDWYERQSTVTLRDHGCGTQPQRTGVEDTGYGRPGRAKLHQGVGPQLRWLRRRRRSRVALNRWESHLGPPRNIRSN